MISYAKNCLQKTLFSISNCVLKFDECCSDSYICRDDFFSFCFRKIPKICSGPGLTFVVMSLKT